MNALEIAKKMDAELIRTVKVDILHNDAATLLRRQHEAIRVLREALTEIKTCYLNPKNRRRVSVAIAEQALKDTEEFQ